MFINNIHSTAGVSSVSPDFYLWTILNREQVATGVSSPVWAIQSTIQPIIVEWANGNLISMLPSGSFSKGTCNKTGDIDFFISLSPDTKETLKEIHDKLFTKLTDAGYTPKRQNVSIHVNVLGQPVDLVPGKLQNYLSTDHSLYRRRADTWTKTNVSTHINHVRTSGRIPEIRIIKLWRDQKKLDFPSFYLELSVMKALAGNVSLSLSEKVWAVLHFLRDQFAASRIVDPANTSNILSDELTDAEKKRICSAARVACDAETWEQIVL